MGKALADNSCSLAVEPFDAAEELRRFGECSDGAGAIASFTGVARPIAKDGAIVHSLYLEHHPTLTIQSLERIAAEAAKRFALGNLRIVHRHGSIASGEPIVFVAASAQHRKPALQAVDFMMDRLKTDAFFWKREDRADGAEWIEPSEADYAARAER